jgi:hypothetical protein
MANLPAPVFTGCILVFPAVGQESHQQEHYWDSEYFTRMPGTTVKKSGG